MELNEILSGLNACKDDLSPSGTRGLFGGSLIWIIVLFILFCGCGNGFGGGYPGAYPPVAPGPTSAVSPFATESHKTKKKIPVCKVSNYYPIEDQCCGHAPFAGVSPYSAAPAPAPYGGGFGGCGFGGGSWWIWIIIIFCIFGFGRRNSVCNDIV